MNAAEKFEQIYKKPAQHTAFTPYRVCPIGAHSDHQLGKITGIAILTEFAVSICQDSGESSIDSVEPSESITDK